MARVQAAVFPRMVEPVRNCGKVAAALTASASRAAGLTGLALTVRQRSGRGRQPRAGAPRPVDGRR